MYLTLDKRHTFSRESAFAFALSGYTHIVLSGRDADYLFFMLLQQQVSRRFGLFAISRTD